MTDREAAFRSDALSLAKAFSIRLKLGLLGRSWRGLAPDASITWRTRGPLRPESLFVATILPGRSCWTSILATQFSKVFRSMGQSTTEEVMNPQRA